MKIKKLVSPESVKPDELKFEASPVSSSFNKRYLFFGIIIFIIAACIILYFFVFKNSSDKITSSENESKKINELKMKELELKEKELKLREQQLNQKNNSINSKSSDDESSKDEIRQVVNNMLNAWQNKNISGFFSNLTSDYRYESIDGIRRNYNERLNKAYDIFANNNYINISVWDMNVNTDGEIAEVTYKQDYRSTLLSDVTTKKLFLRKENNTWRVYKELSGFN